MEDKKKIILIAEDDRVLGRELKLELEKEGFVVKIVTDGKEALEQVESGGVDFLVLDLLMPEMDGFEVIQHLREKKIEIPMLVLSNLGQKEDIERMDQLGIENFFVKAKTPPSKITKEIRSRLS